MLKFNYPSKNKVKIQKYKIKSTVNKKIQNPAEKAEKYRMKADKSVTEDKSGENLCA